MIPYNSTHWQVMLFLIIFGKNSIGSAWLGWYAIGAHSWRWRCIWFFVIIIREFRECMILLHQLLPPMLDPNLWKIKRMSPAPLLHLLWRLHQVSQYLPVGMDRLPQQIMEVPKEAKPGTKREWSPDLVSISILVHLISDWHAIDFVDHLWFTRNKVLTTLSFWRNEKHCSWRNSNSF